MEFNEGMYGRNILTLNTYSFKLFLILLFILFFIFPKKVSFLDFRFISNGLTVRVDSKSPILKPVEFQFLSHSRSSFDSEASNGKSPIFKKKTQAHGLSQFNKVHFHERLKEKLHMSKMEKRKIDEKKLKNLSARKQEVQKENEESEKNEKLQLIHTRLVSGDSFLKNQEVKGALIRFPFLDFLDFEKKVDKIKIHPDSNFIVKTSLPHHRSGLFVAQYNLNQNQQKLVPVFSESYIQSLFHFLASEGQEEIRTSFEEVSKRAILFGKVVNHQGDPLKGAKVEIDDEEASIIYFSGFIPDLNRENTSSNGMFVILNLEDGIRSLRFLNKGVYSLAQSVPVKAHHISNITLNYGKERMFRLKPYHAFNGSFPSSSVNVKIFGQEKIITLDSKNQKRSIPIRGGNHPIKFYMDPGSSYALASYSSWNLGLMPRSSVSSSSPLSGHEKLLKKREETFSLPAFPEEWLIQLIQKGKEPYDFNGSIVLFLIENTDHTSFEFNHPKLVQAPKVYFNSRGEFVPTKSFNENWGSKDSILGFVMYNVDEGLEEITVLVKEDSSKKSRISKDLGTHQEERVVYNRIFVPDPDPNVLNVFLI